MCIDFSNLPHIALNGIFKLLDDPTILRMREVSKATKDLLEGSYLLTSRRRISLHIIVAWEGSRPNEIKHTLMIPTPRIFTFIEICMSAVLKKLDIHPNCRSYDSEEGAMFIYIASAEAKAFLELLKPLFVNVAIGRLCIHNLHSKRINIYSDFFESKYVSNILIRDVEEPFTDLLPYLHLIEKIGPDYVCCMFDHFTTDWIEFAQKLVDKVDQIRFSLANNSHPSREITSLALSLLQKRCYDLYIEALISMKDVERLLNSFHRMERKVIFTAHIDEPEMEYHIGVYHVKVEDLRYMREPVEITISHISL